MATVSTSSQGSKLKVTITATPTVIPQMQNLAGPTTVTEYDDITCLDSSGNYKEWDPELKDNGAVTFDLVYDPANTVQNYLRTANVNSTLETFQEEFGSVGTHHVNYTAYVSKFEFTAATGKAWRVKVELKVSGPVTFT